MKYIILLVLLSLVTCKTASLIVMDGCDTEAKERWIKGCIEDNAPTNVRETEYYSGLCKEQADAQFYIADSGLRFTKPIKKIRSTNV
ncbi:MAG: hypothetical protein UT21_C0006G0022 [Candidatus Woesebacteria bacterium GW2011_GWA1_39_11b]|nr:MAG: hypothetical protein UT21_C0006G0022 [Candidatus Woesebacteria bacterium GW2011_GWA1_39_11b]KKS77100.1 MAG: hypothetical protein UV51_C0010G0005 [Candidatus Woesebacteria bacterium GW2011_GWC1_42_9]